MRFISRGFVGRPEAREGTGPLRPGQYDSEAMVMRIAQTPGHTWLDMSGVVALDVSTRSPRRDQPS
ncbi:hypothetical protein GCM10010472_06620 [Pseudonocardia halophobica]|uniref:Uncharacterized protein n=1 Tax=Pseudonocardia halophobica TaxID=29401 RepID=A0A9W6KYA5_9PSEU|nr:hypothetical protein GCM10017577_13410 [Pseudonocardia halophobica]